MRLRWWEAEASGGLQPFPAVTREIDLNCLMPVAHVQDSPPGEAVPCHLILKLPPS